jgi:hypothetical protein
LALEDGQLLEATELATRAIAILDASKAEPLRKVDAEFVLARARWGRGDRRRAIRHAEDALAHVRGAGMRVELATSIATWLATHQL